MDAKTKRALAALGRCQRMGRRLGTASRVDGVWVYYVLDGWQWRFRHGQAVGPTPIADHLRWRVEAA